MKALSCKQPWADMLLQGEKSIETRSRKTNFRGLFVLHSSKIPDKEAMEYFKKSDLPNGFLLGILKLKDVYKYESNIDWISHKQFHKCYWIPTFPKYGYLIGNDIIKFDNPIPYRGNLGFWNINKHELGVD